VKSLDRSIRPTARLSIFSSAISMPRFSHIELGDLAEHQRLVGRVESGRGGRGSVRPFQAKWSDDFSAMVHVKSDLDVSSMI